MKRILALVVLLSGYAAGAATYTVPSLTGASIQATLNSASAAGSGNTVLLPAGLYNIGSTISVPCQANLTITGPVANPATATLNATFGGNAIFAMSGCTGITIQYLQFRNTSGLYFGAANNANITISHNQFLNLPSQACGTANACGSNYSPSNSAIFFDGSLANAVVNNTLGNMTDHVTVTYNTFGDASSCAAVFARSDDNGGTCAGLTTHTGTISNLTVQYNSFVHVEEPIHLLNIASGYNPPRTQSVADNIDIEFNYIATYKRIGTEIQTGVVNHPVIFQHNVVQDPLSPTYGTFATSFACCTQGFLQGSSTISPALIFNDSVLITSIPSSGCPPYGVEFWGSGSQGTNSLVEGSFCNGYTWGFGTGAWAINNNYICGTKISSGGYITNEERGTNPPSQSGNVTGPVCSARASTAATISPAAGAYTSPPTITLADSGANTSVWYTADGSTPAPGSGTTRLYTGPFSITVPITIKAAGMWGVPPQPTSYPANYGYVPSAVATATYTASGGLALSSVALSNGGAVHSLVTGTSVAMTATCSYSDGSTTNCNSIDVHGNSVSLWNSSSPAVAISAGGVASGVAAGTANLTATVAGLTTPVWPMAVTTPTVSLSSVLLQTTGGVASLVAGGVNQLLGTCSYSDGSKTNCAVADTNGNVVSPWTSSAPTVATVSSSGVVTALAAGSTQLTATVTPGMTTTQWGQPVYSTAGVTYPGAINATYLVLGSQPGGYSGVSCSFYLPPGTLTVGAKYDCGLIPAPTPTTQGTAWQCWYTYTVSSSASPGGFVTGSLNNCGNLADGTAWWVGVDTNQAGASPAGFYNCGSTCGGAAPAVGSGTYPYRFIAAPYGTRSGMATAMSAGNHTQAAQYVTLGQPGAVSNAVPLTVSAAAPTLVSAYLGTPGGVNTITTGATLQFSAHCVYSDSSTTDCSVADIHGNAVSNWTTSQGNVVSIGAVGSARPGLVAALAAGSSNIQAYVGSLASSLWGLTVTAPAVSLAGVSLATANGVTGLFVGSTNLLVATCLYSDGATTQCNSTDSHGNVAGGYVSSTPGHATVNVSGLVTGVAPGSTTLQVSAGGFSSAAIPLTVLAVPSGTYTITIHGPVTFSGKVQF